MSHQSQLRFFTTDALQRIATEWKAELALTAASLEYKPSPLDAVARTLLADIEAELKSRQALLDAPAPTTFYAIRAKLSHIRSIVEELTEDARQLWNDSDGELDEQDDSLIEELEQVAADIAELEPEDEAPSDER